MLSCLVRSFYIFHLQTCISIRKKNQTKRVILKPTEQSSSDRPPAPVTTFVPNSSDGLIFLAVIHKGLQRLNTHFKRQLERWIFQETDFNLRFHCTCKCEGHVQFACFHRDSRDHSFASTTRLHSQQLVEKLLSHTVKPLSAAHKFLNPFKRH